MSRPRASIHSVRVDTQRSETKRNFLFEGGRGRTGALRSTSPMRGEKDCKALHGHTDGVTHRQSIDGSSSIPTAASPAQNKPSARRASRKMQPS